MVEQQKSSLRVGFVLVNKFTLAAFGGIVDAIRLAADDGRSSSQMHTSWKIMTPGSRTRKASCGLEVNGISEYLPPSEFDYIAVCGGNDFVDASPSPALESYLREAHKSVRLLGVCTGTFQIARAGLLDGRTVCVHWNAIDAFKLQFPSVRTSLDRLFIDEGDVITCAGSTAAIDLGLYLVSRHCGRGTAQKVVRHMMLTGIRAPSLPQAHFLQDVPNGLDDRVLKALHFMEQQLDYPLGVPAVARYVGISVRQLERSFKLQLGLTPMKYHRILRLSYGRWRIQHTRDSLTRIALDCGFSDAAHFSREFRMQFDTPPSLYRRSLAHKMDIDIGSAFDSPKLEQMIN